MNLGAGDEFSGEASVARIARIITLAVKVNLPGLASHERLF